MRSLAFAIGLLAFALTADADSLRPVDQAQSEPSFAAFRWRLLKGLEKKDTAVLFPLLDPGIRASFGAGDGVKTFRQYWKLDTAPATSGLWSELTTAIRLGSTREEDEFVAPYVFTRFPKDRDAFTHAAVIKPAVKLRKLPKAGATIVGTLDYEVVQLLTPVKNGWYRVRTDAGKQGWLPQADVRSPLDYRAFFEKKNGRWFLTAFVKGD
ncbi:MAG: SH3 domain-containing protein [Bryobacteraceae bacterium]|nr:SH3 domain-containing protein [Bryobacteraceae bacterium]